MLKKLESWKSCKKFKSWNEDVEEVKKRLKNANTLLVPTGRIG